MELGLAHLCANTLDGTNIVGGRASPVFDDNLEGKWAHLALVLDTVDKDGSFNLVFYINGIERYRAVTKGIKSFLTRDPTSATLAIGFNLFDISKNQPTSQWTKLRLDEFRLWSISRSVFEINSAMYRKLDNMDMSNTTPFPLFASLSFDDGDRVQMSANSPGNSLGWYNPFASRDTTAQLVGDGKGSAGLLVFYPYAYAASDSERPFSMSEWSLAADTSSQAPVVTGVDYVYCTENHSVNFTLKDLIVPRGVIPSDDLAPHAVPLTDASIASLINEGRVSLLIVSMNLPSGANLTLFGSLKSVYPGQNLPPLSVLVFTPAPNTFSSSNTVKSSGPLLDTYASLQYRVIVNYENVAAQHVYDSVGEETIESPIGTVGFEVMRRPPPQVGYPSNVLKCNGGSGGGVSGSTETIRNWAVAETLTLENYLASNITIEFWFLMQNHNGKPDASLLGGELFSWGDGEDDSHFFNIYFDPKIRLFFILWADNLFQPYWLQTAIPYNKWTHLAVSLYKISLDYYLDAFIDGEIALEGSQASKGPQFGTKGLRRQGVFLCAGTSAVAASTASSTGVPALQSWEGALDEVRIWKTRRTLIEIQQAMFVSLPETSYSFLFAYWNFDDPSTFPLGAIDISGNAHHLTYGGCGVTRVSTRDACSVGSTVTGGVQLAPVINRASTWLPKPTAPILNTSPAVFMGTMGQAIIVPISGYEPILGRCPHGLSCNDVEGDDIPMFILSLPADFLSFANILMSIGSEPLQDGDVLPYSTQSLIVVPIAPKGNAGGRPLVQFSYILKNSLFSSATSQIVQVNVPCKAGTYLSEQRQCITCTSGTYQNSDGYATSCCDPSRPNSSSSCLACAAGLHAVVNDTIGIMSCVPIPCVDRQFKALVDGQPTCIPMTDSPPLQREAVNLVLKVLTVISSIILLLLFYFRNTRHIHNASPVLCYVIMIGGTLLMISATFAVAQPTNLMCKLNVVLFNLSYMTVFGAMFVKSWRLYRVFRGGTTRTSLKLVKISTFYLIFIIACLLAIDATIILLYFALDPPVLSGRLAIDFETTGLREYVCVYSPGTGAMFAAFLGTTKIAITAATVYISYCLRDVPDVFNETRQNSLAIYTSTLLIVVVTVVNTSAGEAFLPNNVHGMLDACNRIISGAALTLFVMGSKIVAVYTTKDAPLDMHKFISHSHTSLTPLSGSRDTNRATSAKKLTITSRGGSVKPGIDMTSRSREDNPARNLAGIQEGAASLAGATTPRTTNTEVTVKTPSKTTSFYVAGGDRTTIGGVAGGTNAGLMFDASLSSLPKLEQLHKVHDKILKDLESSRSAYKEISIKQAEMRLQITKKEQASAKLAAEIEFVMETLPKEPLIERSNRVASSPLAPATPRLGLGSMKGIAFEPAK